VRAIAAHARVTGASLPRVFHTNEGHAGFLGLERISTLMADGLDFDEALQVVRAGTVFTTHTPVPAGIDRFDVGLVRDHVTDALLPGVPADRVLELGAEGHDGGSPDVFNMALMGLRLAQRANGVSQLHGEVSRGMFAGLWPGFDTEEVPITSVTNGVHAPTWTDPMLMSLASDRLGTDDTTTADWSSPAVTDGDLWDVRGRMRRQLVADARRRVTRAWREQNPGAVEPSWLEGVLDPEVLTIGFARRVPTYKRLTLMLHDRERLRRILTDPARPVQIVVAGKSHPADDEGKRLIQELVRFAAEPEIRGRLVFLPDYDIGMAQLLYPGTDVWLNNPLRPLEACGTSGMKAALNGALNLSILDGWWNEYYDGGNGWAIPSADGAHDGAERDAMEATALYDLIENRIAPRFYERDADGVPAGWVHDIRHTLRTLSPELSADRMVRQYVERLYVPAGLAQRVVAADDHARARELAAWRGRVAASWPSVQVAHVESEGVGTQAQVGDELRVRAWVALGGLDAEDVTVEVVHGRTGEGDVLTDVTRHALEPVGGSGGQQEYGGTVPLASAGPFGYTVRVVPRHELLASSAEPGLVAVAS
jgi:starch phosphorylase